MDDLRDDAITSAASDVGSAWWAQGLRWLAVLPGAALGAGLMRGFLVLFVVSSNSHRDPNVEGLFDSLDLLWRQVLLGACWGATFVSAGSFIAPCGRKIVAWILALLLSAGVVFLLNEYSTTIVSGSITETIALVIVAIGTAWKLESDHTEP